MKITDRMDPEMMGTGVPEPGCFGTIRMKKTVTIIHAGTPHRAYQAQRSPRRKPVRQTAVLKRAIVAREAPSVLNFTSIRLATFGLAACSSFQLMPVMLCI